MRASSHRLFVTLLAVVSIYRLTLLERGVLAFVDETRYFKSVMVLQALGARDLRGALTHVATSFARPGATLIQLPAAALQAVPAASGVAASNPRSLLIPAVFNVGVSLAALWFFYATCVVLCDDATAAVTAAALYALLVNSNLYIRHLLPYDWAMLVGSFAIWLAVTRPRTAWLGAAVGLLAGGVITIYPGYYLLAAVVGAITAGQAWPDGWRRAVRIAAAFAAAFACVILATEFVCRAVGVSYLESARELSRTIAMGSFDEGWTFLPAYLLQVERLSGVVLLAGTTAALWRAASRLAQRAPRPIDWLLWPAFLAWAWQAASSAQWHTMVLYGRLIHPWMMFMAWAVADTLAAIDRATLRHAACALVVMAAVISWAPSAWTYLHLAYPPDVLYALRIDTAHVPPGHMECELLPGTSYASPGPLNRATGYPYTSAGNYVLINFCQALGLTSVPPPTLAMPAGELLYDGPHWMTFRAYGFEGLPPAAREAMAHYDYRVRAFRVPQ